MTLQAALLGIVSAALLATPYPSTAYIVGFVQDTTCTPAPGVRISSPDASSDAVSDAQGRFALALSGERPRADISAHLAGFRAFTRTGVRVGTGGRDAHTLSLDPSELAVADPVIVTAGRTPLVPPTDGKLRGEILTIVCTHVEGAQVAVAVHDHEVVVRSDANGRFAFGDLTAGKYALQVRAQGYIPVVRNGTTVGRETPHVRVLLERGADGERDQIW
jgi:hypothetical protein